jgi:hypothetical protein
MATARSMMASRMPEEMRDEPTTPKPVSTLVSPSAPMVTTISESG